MYSKVVERTLIRICASTNRMLSGLCRCLAYALNKVMRHLNFRCLGLHWNPNFNELFETLAYLFQLGLRSQLAIQGGYAYVVEGASIIVSLGAVSDPKTFCNDIIRSYSKKVFF